MNIQEFITEMNDNYFNNGCYHAVKNPPNGSTSGNHHILNATYYTIIDRHNKLNSADQQIASEFIIRCEEKPGIYNRAPDKFDHQAHDDYIGIACTSKKLFLPFAMEIYKYGKKHFWYYDNTEETTHFEFKNWHGRFPWAICTYKTCANGNAPLFYKLAFGLYMYAGTFNNDKSDTSGRILRWLQKESLKGQSKLLDFFINLWEADIKKKYTDGMGDVFGIYYGLDHPFSKIMKGEV